MADKLNREKNRSIERAESSDSEEDEVNLQAVDAVEVDDLVKSVPGFPRRRSSDDTSLNQEPVHPKQEEVTFCQWLTKLFNNFCCCQSSEDERSDRRPIKR